MLRPGVGLSLRDKWVIALGDVDGVPGVAIAACAEGLGVRGVFAATTSYTCAAAGAMDHELQRALLHKVRQVGPAALVVVLGQLDVIGVETYARTLRHGDPAYAGALSRVALGLQIVHVFDPEFKRLVDPAVWQQQIGMLERAVEAEALVEAARACIPATERPISRRLARGTQRKRPVKG